LLYGDPFEYPREDGSLDWSKLPPYLTLTQQHRPIPSHSERAGTDMILSYLSLTHTDSLSLMIFRCNDTRLAGPLHDTSTSDNPSTSTGTGITLGKQAQHQSQSQSQSGLQHLIPPVLSPSVLCSFRRNRTIYLHCISPKSETTQSAAFVRPSVRPSARTLYAISTWNHVYIHTHTHTANLA